MSEVSEDKSAPTGQTPASAEPRLAETGTKLATNPSGTEAETSKETSTTESKPTYTEMASNVAGQAGAAAAGVKDSVFSMFGGGGAKEKRVEQEDDAAKDEPSGSSKATKEKEVDDEVRLFGFPCKLLKQPGLGFWCVSLYLTDILLHFTGQGRRGRSRRPLRAGRAPYREGRDQNQ